MIKFTKSNYIKFSFVVLLLTGLIFTPSLKIYSQELSQVEVFNNKVRKIPSSYNFVGVNWYWDSIANVEVFNSPEHTQTFIESIKSLDVDFIRYPGGNNIYMYFWDVPPEEIYRAQNITWYKHGYQRTLKEFLDFCNKAELKTSIQLNTNNYFDKIQKKIICLKNRETGKVDWGLVKKAARNSAEEVKWVKDNNYNDIVIYWELGNEEYLRNLNSAYYTGSEYAKVVSIFIEELRKIDPDIKLLLTTSYGNRNTEKSDVNKFGTQKYMYKWNVDVLSYQGLSKFKNNIFASSVHIYPFFNYLPLDVYENYKRSIIGNPDVNTNFALNNYRSLLNSQGYNNSVIFVNEFNATNSKKCPYSHNWLGALGNAKMILSCAGNPYCYHMDYHCLMTYSEGVNDVYNNNGYGLFHYAGDFSIPFIKYPAANVVSLLNQNIKGNILKTTFNNKNLYAVTSESSDLVRVIVLNIGKEMPMNLKLSGFNKLIYSGNKSLGINIDQNFTVMDTGDSMSSPSEVRLINELDNAIGVKFLNAEYKINLPANTLSVFYFKKA